MSRLGRELRHNSFLRRAASAAEELVQDRLAFHFWQAEDFPRGPMLQPGQLVRVNLAGLQAEGVMFQAAVTDAVAHIVKQTSEQPPKYLVKLLFSFRGVTEVEVPADRIHADK
jgi:hypothetical protein